MVNELLLKVLTVKEKIYTLVVFENNSKYRKIWPTITDKDYWQ